MPNPIDTRELTLPDAMRLVSKLWDKTILVHGRLTTPCWTWTGGKDTKGYGTLWIVGSGRRHLRKTHRVSAEIFITPFDPTLDIDHLCRNPPCWNPSHLELVPVAENTRRGVSPSAQNSRKTHCPSGHEYSAENTRVETNGGRTCRVCQRARDTAKRRALGMAVRPRGRAPRTTARSQAPGGS